MARNPKGISDPKLILELAAKSSRQQDSSTLGHPSHPWTEPRLMHETQATVILHHEASPMAQGLMGPSECQTAMKR